MVKRTAVVLSIMSLLVVGGASVALAQWGFGGCGDDAPLYVGVNCPPVTKWTTIIKTWEGKVEAPYAPMPAACGPVGCNGWNANGPGLMGGLAAALVTPMDLLFGGFDGVYGCGPGVMGGIFPADGPCGPFWGPIPSLLGGVGKLFGAPTTLDVAIW
jgi:hypothetical protein